MQAWIMRAGIVLAQIEVRSPPVVRRHSGMRVSARETAHGLNDECDLIELMRPPIPR